MELASVMLVVMVAIIVVPPVFLLRPLIIALADRIAGKQVSDSTLKALRIRLEFLEKELADLRNHVKVVEEIQDFSTKLLEDLNKQRPMDK